MLDFTGERVVPGLVDPDLLNEHLARYRFANRFASGMRVLDAGCGTGYGAAELNRASRVTGIDISFDAVAHARQNFSRSGVQFLQASCDTLPFAAESFDLITAFEVIEHLTRWHEMLTESRRVLTTAGVFLVSTPNKAYYAEARGTAGPNPWHVREFEYNEFEAALRDVFPHVRIWTQNHSEAIVFNVPVQAPGEFDLRNDPAPENAHFFFAACSASPLPPPRGYAWSPSSGNLLRERERHVGLLQKQVRELEEDRAALQRNHGSLLGELKEHNEWAEQLNRELKEAGQSIARLQSEIDAIHKGYQDRVRQLESEAAERLNWVRDIEAQLGRALDEIARLNREGAERQQWGESLETALKQANSNISRLNSDVSQLDERLRLAASSKWVRLGRLFHLGPVISGRDGQQG